MVLPEISDLEDISRPGMKASSKVFPGLCVNVTDKMRPKIVLIDGRKLYGEVLLDGFRAEYAIADYTLYPTLHAWLLESDPGQEYVVLFSADVQPGRTLEECTDDLRQFKISRPATRVIIISSEENPEMVAAALDMGVEGYISTNMQIQAAVHVIQLVRAGGQYIPAVSFQALYKRPMKPVQKEPESNAILSAREILVAKALRKGTPNKLIAYDLNMRESTVKVHVRHIMKKLRAKNRTQVAFLTNSMFLDG